MKERTKKKLNNIALVVEGLGVSQLMPVVAMIGLSTVATGNWVLPMSLIIGYAVAIGMQYFSSKELLKGKEIKETVKKGTLYGVGFVLLNLVIANLNTYLAGMVSAGATTSMNQAAMNDLIKQSPVLIYLASAILAPICEELTFRGGLFNLFKNKNVGLIVSSIAFGLIHFSGAVTNPADLIFLPSYIALGLVLGYVYKKTDNIYITMIMHILNNSFSVLVSLM